MIVRAMVPSDIPSIRQMHELSGIGYPLPDLRSPFMEAVLVIESDGVPVAACSARRIPELSLWMEDTYPATRIHYVKALHEAMEKVLSSKGYHEANCFIPPQLERSFGRRLMRNFSWVRNWPSFVRNF